MDNKFTAINGSMVRISNIESIGPVIRAVLAPDNFNTKPPTFTIRMVSGKEYIVSEYDTRATTNLYNKYTTLMRE